MTTITFRGIPYTVETAPSNDLFLNGTPKPDWIEALGGNNTVVTGAGNDVVLAGVSFLEIGEVLLFFSGQRTIEGIFYNTLPDAGNNKIFAGTGDDYVATGGGDDLVFLGKGNDIFDGVNIAGGNDTVYGGAGDDIFLPWGRGNKTIDGGAGNDYIEMADDLVEGDRHSINTGTGDDGIFIFTSDRAVVNAGEGNDSIVFGGIFNGTDFLSTFGTINANSGNDNIFTAGDSQVLAGSGDDLIGTNAGSLSKTDLIKAGNGNDTIFTLDGDNLIYGGLGNDTVVSGLDSDTIYDGEGNDIINLRGGTVNLRGGLIDVFGSDTFEVPGGGNDTVYAYKGKDTFRLGLGEGVATIYGYGVGDRIDLTDLGLSSTDVTLAQSSSDTLISVGDDRLAILKATQVCTVTFLV